MGFKARRPTTTVIPPALATVRKRPGMYIGDTDDGSGLHHMLWEVVGNSLDEHLAGRGKQIDVTLHADDSFTVRDHGRGIPIVDINGKPFAERMLSELHFTATADGHTPHTHVGLFGVGLAAVNALSEYFEVSIERDGGRWTQQYRCGRATKPMRRVGASQSHGTTIRLKPDPQNFRRDRAELRSNPYAPTRTGGAVSRIALAPAR